MRDTYENKMLKTESSIKLVPKYIGGKELDFHIGNKTFRVVHGDEVPDLPIGLAKQRKDFVIIKRRKK